MFIEVNRGEVSAVRGPKSARMIDCDAEILELQNEERTRELPCVALVFAETPRIFIATS